MRKAALLFVFVALFSLPVLGQDDQTPTIPEPLRVEARDVKVVQQELYRRGYLSARPNGVLDAATRQALRSFQEKEQLEVTGRINEATITRLGLIMPLSANPLDDERRKGFFPRFGSAVKEGVVGSGKAVGKTANKVGRGVKDGAQTTADATGKAVDKTGETTKSAGQASLGGAKAAGRGVADVTDDARQVLVGRSDADIHAEVRDVLNNSERTRNLKSEVKDGRVTLVIPMSMEGDFGKSISEIRRVSGVRSVVVVNR